MPGLLVFSLIVGAKSAWAAAGSLDLTFGQGGVTVTSFANLNYVIPYAVKLQNDGKILVQRQFMKALKSGRLGQDQAHNLAMVIFR